MSTRSSARSGALQPRSRARPRSRRPHDGSPPPCRDAGRRHPRERDVLAAIAEGLSNRAIAHRLFLCERAVERHVASIFERLVFSAARTVTGGAIGAALVEHYRPFTAVGRSSCW